MLRSYYNRIRNRFNPGNLVLMYHRINEDGIDPWKLSVTPEHFEEHLRVLKKFTEPVPLSEIILHSEKPMKRKKVAVTFDDGYADNLYYAKPILELYSIPATFFISTGNINSSREFWWDELEYLLLQPGILPDILSLESNGNTHTWQLGKAVSYSSEEYMLDFGKLPWLSEAESRLNFYYQVWQKLFPLKNNERNRLLDEISKWAGLNVKLRESHRILKHEELIQLAGSDLFEIGAHGSFHPVLPEHAYDYQLTDIQESKKYLEGALNRRIKSFAYPHGEHSEETTRLVQNAGFTSAYTTEHGSVRPGFNPFTIPRIQIEDWDVSTFLKQLNKWFYQ